MQAYAIVVCDVTTALCEESVFEVRQVSACTNSLLVAFNSVFEFLIKHASTGNAQNNVHVKRRRRRRCRCSPLALTSAAAALFAAG